MYTEIFGVTVHLLLSLSPDLIKPSCPGMEQYGFNTRWAAGGSGI
jgi:hypothetical protein